MQTNSTKVLVYTLLLIFLIPAISTATTRRYRLSYRDDPNTSIVIGWDQVNGSSPVVYYDTIDHGTNEALYQWNHSTVDASNTDRGMNNTFMRLTGLYPGKNYYFFIKDSNSESARYWFKTIPAGDNECLSIVAGGDSRSDWTARQNANRVVSKLRPHFVYFGGDYTNGDSNGEWQQWMDDWQLTISTDGRMYPLANTRGNHEGSDARVTNMFDAPTTSGNVYYALNFGSLIRTYNLNTEISQTGTQASWLASDLAAHENDCIWKFAIYHRPCRPHQSGKSDQSGVYNSWVPEFEGHGVDLVVESDAHVVKETWPILKGTSGPSYESGFYRDDANGIVYVGEGTWAPLRTMNDGKNWTRAGGSFNSFKWLKVCKDTTWLWTVQTNCVPSAEVSDGDLWNRPAGLCVWNGGGTGEAVILTKPQGYPDVDVTDPLDGAYIPTPTTYTVKANATDDDGTVVSVEFFVDGVSIGTDVAAPWEMPWTIPATGTYEIKAEATDNEGKSTMSSINTVAVGNVSSVFYVMSTNDDAEEDNAGGGLGGMYLNSSDLELVYESGGSSSRQVVGVRFDNVTIPNGATIVDAYIQFTCDETDYTNGTVTIEGQAADDPGSFTSANFNISSRARTTANTTWNNNTFVRTVGAAGVGQRTPSLVNIVDELVNRPGWADGNAMAFIIEGTGEIVVESFDGSAAPELHITWAPNGGALPVPEVIGLTATPTEDRQVELSWNAFLTSSKATFEVQASTSGYGFKSIGSMDVTRADGSEFFFLDTDPTENHMFYRIKSIDPSGEVAFSNVVTAYLGEKEPGVHVKLYPNPTYGYFEIKFDDAYEVIEMEVNDIKGQTFRINKFIKKDNRTYYVKRMDYSPGVYFLKIYTDKGEINKKLVLINE